MPSTKKKIVGLVVAIKQPLGQGCRVVVICEVAAVGDVPSRIDELLVDLHSGAFFRFWFVSHVWMPFCKQEEMSVIFIR